MPTKFNPRFGEIAADLRDQGGELLCPWEGDCWRFQAVSHPRGRDILSGKGALQNGGRWNAPGAFPVVYGSTSGAVALEESEANGRYYGIISRNARIYVCIHFPWSFTMQPQSRSCSEAGGNKPLANLQAVLHFCSVSQPHHEHNPHCFHENRTRPEAQS
jgi:hypothetical protein